jgi:adenine-specific DNA-methyltransferase
VHTARKRLIAAGGARGFEVCDLGAAERERWWREALGGSDDAHRRAMLAAYGAKPRGRRESSDALLHGRKGRARVHVGAADRAVGAAEIDAIARAARAAGVTAVDCLAWEFAAGIHARIAATAAKHGVRIRPIRIPREIMEKNRSGPLPWLEAARLEAEAVARKDGGIDIRLTRFAPGVAEAPTRTLAATRARTAANGFDFIDSWAVDFDWREGKPFRCDWSDYRTRLDRALRLESDAAHRPRARGTRMACVKVVDVFGYETSAMVRVRG